jgi:surfactin family lipopeptide synthetase A
VSPNEFSHKVYWLKKLAGELPRTRIFTTSGDGRIVKRQTIEFSLPGGTTEKLLAVTGSSDLSLYIFLLASLYVLLYRYSGESDLLVGSPVLPRKEPGIRRNVFLPIRVVIAEAISARDFLLSVRDSLLEAYAHQDFSFMEIAAHLKAEISQDHGSLFHVLAWCERVHEEPQLDPAAGHVVFAFRPGKERVQGSVTFNWESYEPAFMQSVVGHLQNAIKGMLQGADAQVRGIDIIGEEERRIVLTAFNDNARAFPIDKTLHRLFREQVQRTPDRIAVSVGVREVNYRQLLAMVVRVRSTLPPSGSGRFIGVLQERGIGFLASILAIFDTGAGFMPIDPAYPRHRIEYMLENSDVSVLLSQRDFMAGPFAYVKESFAGEIVYLEAVHFDFAEDTAADALKTEEQNVGSPTDPAYMIYTSGSTGMPKGAVVRHNGAINHIYAKYESLEMNQDCRFIQTAPCSSDIVVWQFLAPVLVGGRVVIADDETARSARLLLAALQVHRVTMVELVPAVLKMLVALVAEISPEERALPCLRWMLVTGEAVPAVLINDWLRVYPEIPVANCYGPTEASDDVTQALIHTPLQDESKPVSIGKPLANIDIYILDRDLKPAPIGVAGELCVAGVAVGLGYWRDPEQTSRKFIRKPFPGGKGPVLYKTGDLARWRADGEIEFLGRMDHQVKIRGVRIEKSEIEAVLLRHPGVREALVDARMVRGEKSLVAYWVANDMPATEAELREHLEGYLPRYMVPEAFVLLEKFPLGASGKIDLKSLPEPPDSGEDARLLGLPRTPIEEVLVALWAKLLNRNAVGVHEDFFAIGGHSLLATMMASQIRDTFKVELPLRSIFELRTVAELASFIDSNGFRRNHPPAPELRPQLRPTSIPLSFAQQRLWFIDKVTPGMGLYNIPAALRLKGVLNVAALQAAMNEMVRRHEILRTTFPEVDGSPVQRIGEPWPVSIRWLDISAIAQPEKELALNQQVEHEIQFSFDVARGPLLRVLVVQLKREEYVLVFTTHHIVSDGWSTAVLVRELCELYRRFTKGEELHLPPLPIQYADFAIWQRSWLTGEVLERQVAYWKRQLQMPLPQLNLPFDFPKNGQRTYRGAVESAVLPQEVVQALHEFCRELHITPFMAMLAAFQIMLHRYSGQEDVIVGADIANRNRLETENLIGFFVNMLVLRTDLSGDPTIAELLQRVRQVALDGYAHQDLPFEKIVAGLQPDRNLSHNPLFQVVIVLQNMPAAEVHVPGAVIHPFELPRRWAKFDLILTLEETDGKLSASIEYNTDLFRPRTIVRMLEHYDRVLAAIIRDPGQRLSNVPVLSEQEVKPWSQSQMGERLSRKDLELILLQAGR